MTETDRVLFEMVLLGLAIGCPITLVALHWRALGRMHAALRVNGMGGLEQEPWMPVGSRRWNWAAVLATVLTPWTDWARFEVRRSGWYGSVNEWYWTRKEADRAFELAVEQGAQKVWLVDWFECDALERPVLLRIAADVFCGGLLTEKPLFDASVVQAEKSGRSAT